MDVFSDTTGEKYLYRYRSASHFSIDEIINNYIYMTARNQLNDLNEFKWHMDIRDKVELIESSTNVKSTFIIDSIKRLSGNEKEEALLKFQEDCVKKLSLGEEEYEVFIYLECMELLRQIEANYDEILRLENSHRIACFSKKPLNATMMGHYGGNEGIVIAYDVVELKKQFGDETLLTVEYLKEPYCFPLLKKFSNSELDVEFEIRQGINGRKYTDWEYEQEVRLVLKDNEALRSKSNQVELLPSAIVGICMAPNIIVQYSNILLHVCKQEKLPIYIATTSDYSYGFTAKLFDEDDFHRCHSHNDARQYGTELDSLISNHLIDSKK